MSVDREPQGTPKLQREGDEEIEKAGARHCKKKVFQEGNDQPCHMLLGGQVGRQDKS